MGRKEGSMYLVRQGIVVIAVLAMTLLAAACDDDGEKSRLRELGDA